MAKELPFFKFNASEWITGNISFESYELQGLFIKLCAEYWNRNNEMTKEDAIRAILIFFLDKEREDINAKHLKLSNAGRKGGLTHAKATPKHKEVEVEVDKEIEVDKIKKEIPYDWRNENLGTDGFQIKKP